MKTHIHRLLNEFGLNRNQVASFFSLHRSQVTLLLNGARPLPGHQVTAVAGLASLMEKNIHPSQTKKSIRLILNAETEGERQQMLLDARLQLRQYEQRMTAMQQQWIRIEKNERFSFLLRNNNHTLNAKQQRLLEELEYANSLQIPKCNPGQQWIILCRIKSVQALIDALESNNKKYT